MTSNPVLSSTNTYLTVTSAGLGAGSGSQTFPWFPLGTIGGTATGEIGLKVISIGAGTGTSSTTVQGTAADDAATVGNPVFVGGTAVTASSYVGTYAVGDVVSAKFDKVSGGLLTHTRKLTQADDVVSAICSTNPSNLTARLVSAAASTNATSVKTSSGGVIRFTLYNGNAAARYLKFYNKASAPTVGTDTPIWTEYLPAQSKAVIDFCGNPLYFSTGIAYAFTTGSADSDTGALTAGDILGFNLSYV